jgi:hypothetical protein
LLSLFDGGFLSFLRTKLKGRRNREAAGREAGCARAPDSLSASFIQFHVTWYASQEGVVVTTLEFSFSSLNIMPNKQITDASNN